MPQSIRHRQQPSTLQYSANGRIAEKLSRGMVYREIYLRLQGQPTVTGGNNSAANTQRGDEWGVVKSIEIVANGTEVIKKITGNELWWLNYFWYGVQPHVTPTVGDGSTANPTFDSVLILPFTMPNTIKPLDTALDSRNLSSLEVVIQWGSHTDINSAASGFTSDPTIEVYSLESQGISGPFSQWRLFQIEKTITATSSRFEVELPLGQMFRSFLINTTDAGVDQGDILNNLKLVSGTTVFADLSAGDDVLAQVHRLRNGIVEPYSGGAYQALRRGNANSKDGWYKLDLVTDGRLSEALDSVGFSELKLEADVTVGSGTTKMTVIPSEIIPIRGAA